MYQNTAVRAPTKSFIVRVWQEARRPGLRGEVECVGTGEKRSFANSFSLLELLDEWRTDAELAV